jgi:hypothetical protein
VSLFEVSPETFDVSALGPLSVAGEELLWQLQEAMMSIETTIFFIRRFSSALQFYCQYC